MTDTRVRVPLKALDNNSLQGIVKQLAEEASKIHHLEAELTMRRRLRRGLITKLLFAGLSTRHIGAMAGMSSKAVSDINRTDDALHRAREIRDGKDD